MLDLISFGHTTTDAFLKIADADLKCDLNHKNCQICFDYAEKIPVDSFTREIGGNAPNVAVGISRLGLKSGVVSNIGKDANGDFVIKRLLEERVSDTANILRDSFGTDYSTIVNFKGERTILAFHEKRRYTFPKNTMSTKWGYLSSMGMDFVGFNAQFLAWAKKYNVKIAFNPGMYELKAGVEKIKSVLQNCELIIVNKEEAEKMTRKESISISMEPSVETDLKPISDIKLLLKGLVSSGPKMAIITDGERGSYAFDGKEFLYMPVFSGNRVEMTGAGDSFSSGLIAGLLYNKNLKEGLRWGAANSASVIGQIGAIKGLLSLEQLELALEKNKEIVAKDL